MTQVNLSDANTTKLLQIQKIILYEMGMEYSIDETLSYMRARNLDEYIDLLESGYEYVSDYEKYKVLKKRK